MNSRRKVTTVVMTVGLVLLGSGVAHASWNGSGSGSGVGKAGALSTPNLSATSGQTASAATINWTAPGGQQNSATYTATAAAPGHATKSCNAAASGGSCSLAGLDASTSYSVAVVSTLANWASASAAATAVTTSASTAAGLVFTNVTVDGASRTPTCTGTIGSTYSCTVPGGANNATLKATITIVNGSGTPTVFSTTSASTINLAYNGKNPGASTVSVPANASSSITQAQIDRSGSNNASITATFNGWTAVLSTT